MDSAATLRRARLRADLTQVELAELAGTSQATLSNYERGRKQPSLATFSRLLKAAGWQLRLEPAAPPARLPAAADHARSARALGEVLALAAELPTGDPGELRYPRLRPAS